MRRIVVLVFSFFIFSFAIADEKAMQQTQGTLKNKKQRQEAIKALPEGAKNADENVDRITGGEGAEKEELYGISAEIMKNFEGKSPEEMQKIMQEASRNPEKFYQSLTPEQQKKIKSLSQKIEDKKKAKP